MKEGEGTPRLQLVRAITSEEKRPAYVAWKRAPQGNRKKEENACMKEEAKILVTDQISNNLIKRMEGIEIKDGQDSFWYALKEDFKMYVELQKIRRTKSTKESEGVDLYGLLKKYKYASSKDPKKDDLVVYFSNTSDKSVHHLARYIETTKDGAIWVRSKFGRDMGIFQHPVELVDPKYGDFISFYTRN